MTKFIGQCVIGIFILVWISILDGLVTSYLWNSFISIPFELSQIDLVQGIGISILVNFLTYHHKYAEKKEKVEIGVLLVELFIYNTSRFCVTMFFAWIVNLWM